MVRGTTYSHKTNQPLSYRSDVPGRVLTKYGPSDTHSNSCSRFMVTLWFNHPTILPLVGVDQSCTKPAHKPIMSIHFALAKVRLPCERLE